MLIHIASAEIQNNLAKSQDLTTSGSGQSQFLVIFSWLAVLVGVLGVVILISSLFLYLVAAGEEPKMRNAHGALWVGILCIAGAVILYLIVRWLIS